MRLLTVAGLAQVRMAFAVSDELLGTFVPIAVYWLYSELNIVLDGVGMDDYRLHPKGEEATRNIVSMWMVLRGVLIQQAFQIAVSVLFTLMVSRCRAIARTTFQARTVQPTAWDQHQHEA